jgi:putative transposase
MICQNNILDPKKLASFLESQIEPYLTGINKEKSPVLEHQEINEEYSYPKSVGYSEKIQNQRNIVTVESPVMDRKRTWKHKLNSLKVNILTTQLLKTLDRVSTSTERTLKPFWNQQSEEMSKKLWLPTEIDCVDSVLNSSKDSSVNTPMGKSWFSIKEKRPQKKNLLATSFQSSQYSLLDSTDLEAIPSVNKSKNAVRMLKMRLFPNQLQKKELELIFDQFRWYYNSVLTVVYTHYGLENIEKNKISFYSVRDLFRKYRYTEEIKGNLIFKDFEFDEVLNSFTVPEWWDKVNNRIPRGAIKKFVSSLNSAKWNGCNKGFKMKYRSKKKDNLAYFEDKAYPSWINNVTCKYWFRTKQGRNYLSLKQIQEQEGTKRGLEIIHEKDTDRYFLYYPVEIDWFPDLDRRNDNQVRSSTSGERVIALDPGVRKFLVGYDPSGKMVFFGDEANKEIIPLLYEIDSLSSLIELEKNDTLKKKRLSIWRRIKGMIDDLHWKSIRYLIQNYDVIILPDYRVSQMIKKGRKIGKMTKRMMTMYAFFRFKTKLEYACRRYGRKLVIVDEAYTSKTCTNCGFLNDLEGQETLVCKGCRIELDRDVNGSRNIFIKNITLRCREIQIFLDLN